MRYFPFSDETYKMAMGVQVLNPDCLLEIDLEHYHAEINLKKQLLAEDYSYYFQMYDYSLAAQWETVELLLPNLVKHYPEHFRLEIQGDMYRWQNNLLDFEQIFYFGDEASLELAPLDWLGRQIQEDLLIMDGTQTGVPLIAGQLCFPNAWHLGGKMGKSFLGIHHEVPQFEQLIGQPSQLMMERLKANRPTWRLNWAIMSINQLDLSTRHAYFLAETKRLITPENAGEKCFLRQERQGFLRLPRTQGVLFTIHTYQIALAEVVKNQDYARLLRGVIKTMPTDVLKYKGITPFAPALVQYLEA
jgi:dimethylamine monooxygenase subunit A